jgi:hypothetical protein
MGVSAAGARFGKKAPKGDKRPGRLKRKAGAKAMHDAWFDSLMSSLGRKKKAGGTAK